MKEQLHTKKHGQGDEIVVFIVRRETKGAECGEELGSGRWLRLGNQEPLCMSCADLAHLEFLSSGNTALTRRGTKHRRSAPSSCSGRTRDSRGRRTGLPIERNRPNAWPGASMRA